MNKLLTTTLTLAALSLLTPTLSLRAEEAKSAAQSSDKEQTVLQGTWEGVEKGEEGKGKSTMTVTGNSMHFQGASKEEWYKATFKVLPGNDPQQLQATITESPAKEFVGKTSTAIFKIEDGTLTLSGKKPGTSGTPKSFDDKEDTRVFVLKKKGE